MMYTIAQLVDNEASKYPTKTAVKHGGRACTYQTLIEQSNQLARYLKKYNLNAGDVVAIAMERSPEMVIVLLALIRSGVTYLPIDNSFPMERINYMLTDAGVKTVITSKKFSGQYFNFPNTIFTEDAFEECTNYGLETFEADIDEESIAYILYTSGSTGEPKGVAVKHSGLLNLLLSVKNSPGISENDVMLASTTISFDIAELEIFLPLISGATMVMADADTVKDGRSLLDIAKSEHITIMQGTPFMWHTMLEAGWTEALPITIFCGGEAMAKELAEKLLTRCKVLWNMYGPTETTIYSIIKKISPKDEVITIGKPVLNTQVYLLDEGMNKVAAGEVGEIYIAGAGVAKGYINKPELTDEKFIADPFSAVAGQKMYKTGDLGKVLDNGDIQCLGRTDYQIKIRGYRVETEEIEHQLRLQKNIKAALVVLYKDTLANMHLVAYIVPEGTFKDADIIEQAKTWKDELKSSLPAYMVPNAYVGIPAIPLMVNGKIDRKALPEPAIEKGIANAFEAPQTEIEILLADIFLQNIAITRIGVNDNFFDLGINSLVAVKIMIQVEKQFGKRLPLAALLKYPTIKQLALAIPDYSFNSIYKSLTPIKPQGCKIPLYIVHGIGLNVFNLYQMASKLDKEQPVYGLQALGLDGTMEPLDNIETIAKFYNNEILMHNPHGPYAIAGYSLGGYIAYEMVRQLEAMGKEVKMLVMFDTNLQYPTHQYALGKKLYAKSKRQLRKTNYYIGSFFKQPVATVRYLRHSAIKKKDILLSKIGALKTFNPDNLPDFMQDIAGKLRFALNNYVVRPYDVKIDLFKAEVRANYIDDPKYLGWGEYALNGIITHEVPGDHKDMFNPPNDQIMANALQKRLDEINEQLLVPA
jgi:amino acid adenylation domain-containing protein